MRFALATLILSFAVPAWADRVVLHDGTTYEGKVRKTQDGLQLQLDYGTITLDPEMVLRVESGPSPVEELERRVRRAADDADALLAVGRWAESRGMAAGARQAYRRVLRLRPDDAEARAGLGHARVDGRWLTSREAKLAAGLRPYGGTWLTPDEIRLREQAQAQARQQAAQASKPTPSPTPEKVERESTTVYLGGAWLPWRPIYRPSKPVPTRPRPKTTSGSRRSAGSRRTSSGAAGRRPPAPVSRGASSARR